MNGAWVLNEKREQYTRLCLCDDVNVHGEVDFAKSFISPPQQESLTRNSGIVVKLSCLFTLPVQASRCLQRPERRLHDPSYPASVISCTPTVVLLGFLVSWSIIEAYGATSYSRQPYENLSWCFPLR